MRILKSKQAGLATIWLIFVVKGAFYCFLFPLWEGYDEFAHFAFIQHIAVHHQLPEPEARVSQHVQESLALAPLPWTLRQWGPRYTTHDEYWRLDDAERQRRETGLRAITLSSQDAGGTDFLYEGKQPPLYYWTLFPLFLFLRRLSLLNAVFALRLVSVVFASTVV